MAITKRDKLGRILPGGKVLSSEQASAQGKLGGLAKAKNSRDQLLIEAGYDNPDEAPAAKRLLAMEAAKGNVTSIKSFLSKNEAKDVSVVVVQPGDRCPTCQQYVIADMQMSEETMDSVIEGLDL